MQPRDLNIYAPESWTNDGMPRGGTSAPIDNRGCRRMCSQPWFRKSRLSGTSPRELLERCSRMPAGRQSVVGGRGWSVAGEVRLAPFGEAA